MVIKLSYEKNLMVFVKLTLYIVGRKSVVNTNKKNS